MQLDLTYFFFFNDTATTEIYTLSLHDALPICKRAHEAAADREGVLTDAGRGRSRNDEGREGGGDEELWRRQGVGEAVRRSEEHTSELQSRQYLVCRLLLEKKTGRRSQRRHTYR